ncbi:hypothetical protein K488DRAFT_90266 [Vararia minispora EC-137]|uniref:Uncharacterized protein n=1 Tax=Vararia minispora EC-137 TaxID=1314806 RepID=A0ACB8Q837_9AGAM|nr:hypothetical protein K488DRAFT_90266 [Vararia minispora EC-137]
MHFPDDTQLEKRFSLGDSIRSMYAFVHSTVLDNVKPIMLVIFRGLELARDEQKSTLSPPRSPAVPPRQHSGPFALVLTLFPRLPSRLPPHQFTLLPALPH